MNISLLKLLPIRVRGLEGVSTSVFGEVLAASTSASDGVMLDVRGYGDINVNEVVRFRQNSGS